MTTPTDNDLNVSLARLMGKRVCEVCAPNIRPHTRDDSHMITYTIPDYRGSLDALFAPGGPVEYANSKGLGVWLGVRGGAVARIMRNIWSKPIRVACADPAEALATALHEAFGKEQGQ